MRGRKKLTFCKLTKNTEKVWEIKTTKTRGGTGANLGKKKKSLTQGASEGKKKKRGEGQVPPRGKRKGGEKRVVQRPEKTQTRFSGGTKEGLVTWAFKPDGGQGHLLVEKTKNLKKKTPKTVTKTACSQKEKKNHRGWGKKNRAKKKCQGHEGSRKNSLGHAKREARKT